MYFSYGEYLRLPAFRDVVEIVKSRSAGVCELCRSRTATEPHHVRYCRWGDVDTPDNLLHLCHQCHTDAHRCRDCGRVNLKARHIKRGHLKCDECTAKPG